MDKTAVDANYASTGFNTRLSFGKNDFTYFVEGGSA